MSADGPEVPERVQLNKGLVGFLTHSGYAHGGNGYEGIAFLLEQFRDSGLADPTDPKHGIDLRALAMRYVGRAIGPALALGRSPGALQRPEREEAAMTQVGHAPGAVGYGGIDGSGEGADALVHEPTFKATAAEA